MNRHLFAKALALLVTLVGMAPAADWPQWRGPNRDGISSESIPTWTQLPPVLWEASLGEAHSAPVVAEGRLFAQYKEGNDEGVAAFDAATGKELWRRAYPAPFTNAFGSGPRATPTHEGGKLYTLGATGILARWRATDGHEDWRVDLLDRFRASGASNLFFGTSASPLLFGDLVLVMVGGKGAGVVALDKETGATRWASQDDRPSYASPILFTGAGHPQAIFLTQQGLVSLDPTEGRALWRWPLVTFNDENACTPVADRDRIIATSVSYGAVCLAVQGHKENETSPFNASATPVWQENSFSSYFSSPVVIGRELYAITGTPAALACIDGETGRAHWTHAPVGLLFASLLVARDKLLVQTDTGLLLLVEPSRAGYKQLAKAQACGPGWIQPALTDGKLYVRDKSAVRCLRVND